MNNNIEPYERVFTAINHGISDRPPVNYIATPEVNDILKKSLKIEDDEKLRQCLGADIR